jgi:hypothetical protein
VNCHFYYVEFYYVQLIYLSIIRTHSTNSILQFVPFDYNSIVFQFQFFNFFTSIFVSPKNYPFIFISSPPYFYTSFFKSSSSPLPQFFHINPLSFHHSNTAILPFFDAKFIAFRLYFNSNPLFFHHSNTSVCPYYESFKKKNFRYV